MIAAISITRFTSGCSPVISISIQMRLESLKDGSRKMLVI